MNIDNFIIALEGYMIPDNDMDIVTEAFNIKEHLKRFWDAVKKFFKRIYDWIQDRIFKVLNRGEILVNKKIYAEFKEMIQKDSQRFGENVSIAINNLNVLIKDKKDKERDREERLVAVNRNPIFDNMKKYLIETSKITQKMINDSKNNMISRLTDTDSVENLEYKSNTSEINSKDIKSNYIIITPTEVTAIKNEIKKFEQHALHFSNIITCSMANNAILSSTDVFPYNQIVKSGLNATHKYMQFLDRILIYPKEPKEKKNKYEVIELGGSFKVTPIVD